LTFHIFKTNDFISRPVGGTAAEAVSLLEDEDANPLWDTVCNNQKAQRKLDRELGHYKGKSTLAKRHREGAKEVTNSLGTRLGCPGTRKSKTISKG
jgi:hypothetical protein